jgi:hypothetical protein
LKEDRYFFNEVETQLREKPLWGSQTQEIHYLEDKDSYKAVIPYMNASQPGLLPEGVFNGLI